MQLTEQMVINHLGQPVKKVGQELQWQCPICLDSHKDNLQYNVNKNVLWCHADPSHAPLICKEIYKKNRPEIVAAQPTPQWTINKEEYFIYINECHKALMSNNDALSYLYESIFINPFTVKECGIGYDDGTINEDNKIPKWVFPVYDVLDNRLKGFEYRQKVLTEKRIWREKDTPSCLSIIWGQSKNEKLYICEGFKDAYILTQWMNYPEDVTIMTPSSGVSSLTKVIQTLKIADFKNIYLCLDNDKGKVNKQGKPDDVSWQTTQALLEAYPFMIDKTPKPTKGKDITDLYKELVYDKQE